MLKKSSEHWVNNMAARDALVVIALLAINGENLTQAREQARYSPRARQDAVITSTSVQIRSREAARSGRNFRKTRW